jgi:hypothetical protein
VRLSSVRLAATAAIGALAITMGAQTMASAAPEPDWRVAAQAEIDAYQNANPEDFTGIDSLLQKYGLPPMKVSVSGVSGELTGSQAETIIESRKKTQSTSTGGVTTFAVPTDAFGVWIANQRDLYNGRKVTGNWNFRDNFVNGSAPDDVATIQTNLGGGCFRTTSTSYRVSDYTGAIQSGLLWLEDAGLNGSPILGIRDRVTGFRLLVDNGYFVANYAHTGKSGCTSSSKLGAQFQYEHNQDGGNGWSASAGWGVFSISYANPGSKLRKSSSIVYT